MSKQPLVTTSFLPVARNCFRHSANLSHAMILSQKFTPTVCRGRARWQRFCTVRFPVSSWTAAGSAAPRRFWTSEILPQIREPPSGRKRCRGCRLATAIQDGKSYGESFSRWGRWSRFQRRRASSLVSAKRNFSVGDSTWPSQKTTLALPWWR